MKVRKNELYEVISNGKFTRKKIPKRDGIHYELERGGGGGEKNDPNECENSLPT